MKRIFALLLILVLVFALCACGAGKSSAGTWVLTGFRNGDREYSAQELESEGVTMILRLNADGSGCFDYGDKQTPFTWEEGWVDTGVKIPFTVKGDTLSIGINDDRMTFTRK